MRRQYSPLTTPYLPRFPSEGKTPTTSDLDLNHALKSSGDKAPK